MARRAPRINLPPSRPEVLALLEGVKAAPDDDAPRLVLADWLEEYGDEADRARAELIRIQCRLERLPSGDPSVAELQGQVRELQKRHQPAWLGPLEGQARACTFRRGLADLEFTPRNFLTHLTAAVANSELGAWVGALRLPDLRPESARATARAPLLAHALSLNTQGATLDKPSATELFSSPNLARLREIRATGIGETGVTAICSSPHLTNLTHLTLGRFLGPAAAAALGGARNLAHLVVLDLSLNRLGPVGALALATSPHLANLRSLNLRYNQIGWHGVAALTSSPYLRGLMRLDLSNNDFGAEGLPLLEAWPSLDNLTYLELSIDSDHHILTLIGSPRLACRVTSLVLSREVTDAGAQALLESPHLGRLRVFPSYPSRINPELLQRLHDRFLLSSAG